jgi:hypothetical protein
MKLITIEKEKWKKVFDMMKIILTLNIAIEKLWGS